MNIIEDIKGFLRKKHNTLEQLIAVNVLVFAIYFVLIKIVPSLHISNYLKLYTSISEFQKHFWGLFTYSFLHEDFFHLLSNMLFLFFFGTLIQEYLGSKKLLNIYVLGGVFGGLSYIAAYYFFKKFGVTLLDSTLGASASVFAIAFAAATLLPEYEFNFLRLFFVKIKYVALFFLVFHFVAEYSKGGFSTIGGAITHLGGAITGYLYILLLRNGRDLGSPIEGFLDWWRNFGKPKPKMRVTHRRYSESTVSSKGAGGASLDPEYFPDQDEVDAILDKIGKSGYESLTREEKQKLYRASQKKD